MRVLVISPHPDDETLGCGGTILKLREKGYSIYWLIMTEMREEIGFSREKIVERKNEITEVSKIYGIQSTIEMGLPTTKLDTIPIADIVSQISIYINDIKPELIFVNNKSDIHTDHKITFQAVISATKPFRANFVEKVLMYETISETDVIPSLIGSNFSPNTFVDISSYKDKKLEIMKIYKSETMEYPLPRCLESIKTLMRYRGSQIGFEYAEAFMLLREIWNF